MLFNSFIFLFAYLPITLVGYLILNAKNLEISSKIWLTVASLFFYAYWKLAFLPIIVVSILVNYLVGGHLGRISICKSQPARSGNAYAKRVLISGVLFNLGLLGYFKYADFFISNISMAFAQSIPLLHIALPLGISYYTFQQIAFLVDSYRGEIEENNLLNYSLFVSFFPQLIMGPIIYYKEMMPQFKDVQNRVLNWNNVYIGFFFIGVGLFKKVVIADTFAVWVTEGYADPASLSFFSAWKASLSYSIQLYFDFSAYTDMAIGVARILNINIPQNFNSPYLSLSIQDFWRRWHITLGRFLRDYIYIPLGGNRKGRLRTYTNLFVTFLIGGIWHGAGWTFVVWGALHGAALCIHRFWNRLGLRMPRGIAWLTTFLFVNAAWVVFRADSIATAGKVLWAMLDISNADLGIFDSLNNLEIGMAGLLGYGVIFIYVLQDLFYKNTQTWAIGLKPRMNWTLVTASAFAAGTVLMMNQNRYSEFIYFQF
jgi:alginate O-acetyltransferase complex protein AlgI